MLRFLLFYSPLSFHVTGNSVKTSILPLAASTTVCVIARDWCEWLPALAFVPLVPIWVWILESKWDKVARQKIPLLPFSTDLLPLYLGGCSPYWWRYFTSMSGLVKDCPSILILSTSRLRDSFGWISRFKRLPHAKIGRCTDDAWKIYSFHSVSLVSPPCLVTSPFLPAGSLRRVIHTSTSGGCNISQPSADQVNFLD